MEMSGRRRGKGQRAEGMPGRGNLCFLLNTARWRSRPRLHKSAAPVCNSGGWTLIELVISITVMTILTLGVIPLVKTSVRRAREQQLRESLRTMREAIKEFHRDTIGIQCAGGATAAPPVQNPGQPGAPQVFIDPRSKVVISDCTIFSVDNPDHFPPTLESLVEGVNVVPRAGLAGAVGGTQGPQATDNKLVSLKKKVYLRAVPVDPITGTAEWDQRSTYDAADASSWGGENVFDVRSKATGTALNGENYSDW